MKMVKKVNSKREKRLRQLMTLIIAAAVSVLLNGFFMVYSYLSHQEINELEAQVVQLQEEITDHTTVNDELIMYISELEYKSSQLYCPTLNPTQGKIAYLTFDDGPTSLTPKVLDVLKEYNVHATFFVNGVKVKGNAEILKRMIEEGHTIGNHTTTHKYETLYSSLDNLKSEILDTNYRVYEATGYTVKAFRFPGGSSNTQFMTYSPDTPLNSWLSMIHELGMEYYDWNVSSLDASGTYKSADQIYEAVINGTKNKTQITVLMHDVPNNQTTLEALPRIIETLLEQGYSIEALTPNSKAIQHKTVS